MIDPFRHFKLNHIWNIQISIFFRFYIFKYVYSIKNNIAWNFARIFPFSNPFFRKSKQIHKLLNSNTPAMTTSRERALLCRTHLLEALANLGAMNRDVTWSQLRSEYSKRHPELTKAVNCFIVFFLLINWQHLYEQFGYKCIIKILRDFLRKDVHV